MIRLGLAFRPPTWAAVGVTNGDTQRLAANITAKARERDARPKVAIAWIEVANDMTDSPGNLAIAENQN
jgi:hypothetical protein